MTTRKKASRKEATRKKASRNEPTRKKASRKEASRTEATRKKGNLQNGHHVRSLLRIQAWILNSISGARPAREARVGGAPY